MPHVTANGLSFHVQELGAGPPVVMVHGLLIGSLASWYFTAAPALARNHRVRVYDLRGHGRSERAPTGYDVRTLAGDLAALTADLTGPDETGFAGGARGSVPHGLGEIATGAVPRGIDERSEETGGGDPTGFAGGAGDSVPRGIDLVGHSWGALVALRFALDHPERVRRLVLVEAPLPPSRVTELAAFLAPGEALPARLLDALPAPLREAVAGGRRQAERLLRSLEYLVLHTTLVDDLRAEPDLDDAELARLACPCLAVYGDRSSCAPAGERLARVVPGIHHLVLPGGHYLHLEARAALISAIEAHLG